MKTLLTVTLLIVAIGATAQDEKNGMAKVRKINGIEVYVMSEPVREYTTVDEVNSLYTASVSMVMPQIVENYVDKANKKAMKENLQYDALIINSDKAILIKWK